MAISWLAALKVVPWGKVMEHAPQVLDKARGLIDKHRPGAAVADPSPVAPSVEPGEVPSLGELKNRCLALQAQCEQLRQTQQQMAQTMTDLAEQNASLIGAVNRMQSRSRVLSVCTGLSLLACAGLALWLARSWP
jgi:hypothetical protein